jgi:L-iditol 2-dehydrogenase
VACCGVCGSDLPRIFSKGTYRLPTICGHEFAGTVAEPGPGVQGFSAGDAVAVFPLLWCGRCPACERGRYAQCENYDYLGSRRDGAFAEYVAAPAKNLLKVPDGVSMEEAAMTEPAAVALHALRRGGLVAGESVVIFGAGPNGLMAGLWARASGASRIIICDLVEEKLRLARALGLSPAVNSRREDPAAAIGEATHRQGVHLAIEAAGAPATLVHALQAVRSGGRVVILGYPSADVTLGAELISRCMRREIGIFGAWNSDFSSAGNTDDWHTALDAMAAKRIDLRPLVTHRIALGESLEMLRRMNGGGEFYSKVLIYPLAPTPNR